MPLRTTINMALSARKVAHAPRRSARLQGPLFGGRASGTSATSTSATSCTSYTSIIITSDTSINTTISTIYSTYSYTTIIIIVRGNTMISDSYINANSFAPTHALQRVVHFDVQG